MKLIAGLGNVGSRYTQTRHNVGFMVADELARTMGASWHAEPKLEAIVALTEQDGHRIILAKPQTMMNLSGQSIQKIMQFYKIPVENVWTIFDDVDIPFGKLRLRSAGTSGGHQGVSSTIQTAGPGFVRVRVGISLNDRTKEPSEVYVLKPFSAEERPLLPAVIAGAAGIIREQLASETPSETTFTLVPDPSAHIP